MHTHQQAGLRIATCGLLVLAFAASAEDGIATGAAQAPVLVLESPVPELPVVAVSELGHAVAVDRLSALRGGDGSQTENLINVDGSVDDNTAHHITSGTNIKVVSAAAGKCCVRPHPAKRNADSQCLQQQHKQQHNGSNSIFFHCSALSAAVGKRGIWPHSTKREDEAQCL